MEICWPNEDDFPPEMFIKVCSVLFDMNPQLGNNNSNKIIIQPYPAGDI